MITNCGKELAKNSFFIYYNFQSYTTFTLQQGRSYNQYPESLKAIYVKTCEPIWLELWIFGLLFHSGFHFENYSLLQATNHLQLENQGLHFTSSIVFILD